MLCGMMPALPLPGEMIPGQFGPMSRAGLLSRNSSALIMSIVGMPSVMHTIRARPASADSMIASAANGGGTKITEALAPVCSTASATVLKMGHPSWVVPPFRCSSSLPCFGSAITIAFSAKVSCELSPSRVSARNTPFHLVPLAETSLT